MLAGVRWNPTFQLFVFLLRLLLLLGTATTLFTGLLVCTFGHDVCVCGLCVRRVRTSTVHTAIAQHVCVDRFCACVMLREHVTCATTTYCCRSIKLFKVNSNELFESAKLYLQIRLSSDVVRRPSRVVVRRASSFVARASFTLLPRLVTVLRKKEPI